MKNKKQVFFAFYTYLILYLHFGVLLIAYVAEGMIATPFFFHLASERSMVHVIEANRCLDLMQHRQNVGGEKVTAQTPCYHLLCTLLLVLLNYRQLFGTTIITVYYYNL